MSELKSPRVQVTRFRVVDDDQHTTIPTPASMLEVVEALQEHVFAPIDEGASEFGSGWVPVGLYRQADFLGQHQCLGRHTVFSFRYDRRIVQPAAYRKAYEDAVDVELELGGKTFLSRDRKKELAERVRLQIFSRIPPTPNVVDLVWDIARKVLIVTSHANVPLRGIEKLFYQTFNRQIQPFTPSDIVGASIAPENEEGFWTGVLSWLWTAQESKKNQGPNAFTSEGIQVQFSDRIELSGHNGTVKVRSEAQAWDEVRAGIKEGKVITSASLWVCVGEDEYDILVKGDGDITVKGPKVEADEEDKEAVLLERVFLLNKGLEALDAVASVAAKKAGLL